ncbi:MAG: methionine biosynthesis protein MetW, partial [Gammaproteobacteria bacterium]|nr:methionine biosynthesis protein MetW [Gammaproteobacteria bacterium]
MNQNRTDLQGRPDLQIISQWIEPGAHILDLGCGDGTLLAYLQQHKQVTGYGLEIDPNNIAECIRKNVNVIQIDLDKEGLQMFADNRFDYVVMTQSLQTMHVPDR